MLTLCLLGVFSSMSQAEDPEWSHAHWGLYGQPTSDYYTSRDSPFDFFILQMSATGTETQEQVAGWDRQLAKIAATGRRAIPFCWFWMDYAEKDGKLPLPSVQEAAQRLDYFLSRIDLDNVYAITLAEENVWFAGRAQLLTDLYHWVKAKYPDLRVYQWYTPTHAPKTPGFDVPYLPADGWVIDEYWVSGEQLEKMLVKFRMLGVPVLHLAWAAPNWPGGPARDPQTRVPFVLKGQIEACRKLNVPVGFFTIAAFKRDGEQHRLWAFRMTQELNDPQTLALFNDLVEQAKVAPGSALGPDVNDRSLQHWPAVGPFRVVPDDRGDFTYQEDFAQMGSRWLTDATVDGALDLRWNPGRLYAQGDTGRPGQASLTYHFISDTPMPTARAHIEAVQRDNGKAQLAMSYDGRTWPIRDASQVHTDQPTKELWVRVIVQNNLGDPKSIASEVTRFVFDATAAPLSNKAIELTPDADGLVHFVEDFRSPWLRQTATLTGEADMHWERGGVSVTGVKGRSVTAGIEQRFVSDIPLYSLRVTLSAYADVRDHGGHVELSVSPDGRTWLTPVSADESLKADERVFNGVLELDLVDHKALSGNTSFVVRIMLRNTSGAQTSVPASIGRLEVTARGR